MPPLVPTGQKRTSTYAKEEAAEKGARDLDRAYGFAAHPQPGPPRA